MNTTRTEQRQHLGDVYRIERLEEDADDFDLAVAKVMARLNWLIGLVFTLTVAIFTALLTITTR